MTVNRADALLAQAAETLRQKTGLRFTADRRSDLLRGITSAAREMGFGDWSSLALWLIDATLSRKDIETLASHLTVGETYFRRDQKVFDFLEQIILPEIALGRGPQRRLRIWSAGCSTGEEPYSVAISVQRAIPDWKSWDITILATEIHLRLIEKARRGIYRQWSFRNCPDWLKQLYFTRKENDFEITSHIREMVSFDYLNLAEDAYPSLSTGTNAMDVIFCRNVLMYFDEEAARRAIDSFHRSLVEGGWLVTGATDAPSSFFSRFEPINFQGATLYRKSELRAGSRPLNFSKKEIEFLPKPV
ncbi:MAG TPA: CheR family methyltransferase, partial [Blastocatellia bacterium]